MKHCAQEAPINSIQGESEFAASEPFHPAQRKLLGAQKPYHKTHEPKYLPTLFDRLADYAPSKKKEAPEEYTLSRNDVKEIVQRDLSYLLNALNIADLLDESKYPEVASSTLNYGVPGFAGNYLASRKWKDIERIIRDAIIRFEPRIEPKSLHIKRLDVGPSKYNQLMFEISGWMLLQPYPLEFIVQSSVDMETNRFTLTSLR